MADKVGLRWGKGMLSVAAGSAPDRVMAVPFTPQLPASPIGRKGKGYAENQACDKGKGKLEFVEGSAQDTVVASPCAPRTRRVQPALNMPEMVVPAKHVVSLDALSCLDAMGGDDVKKANITISQLKA